MGCWASWPSSAGRRPRRRWRGPAAGPEPPAGRRIVGTGRAATVRERRRIRSLTVAARPDGVSGTAARGRPMLQMLRYRNRQITTYFTNLGPVGAARYIALRLLDR